MLITPILIYPAIYLCSTLTIPIRNVKLKSAHAHITFGSFSKCRYNYPWASSVVHRIGIEHGAATITTSLLPLNYAKRQTKQATIYVYNMKRVLHTVQQTERTLLLSLVLCTCVASLVDVLTVAVCFCSTTECMRYVCRTPHIHPPSSST